MKLFKCKHCGQVLYFENRICGQCGSPLGFLAQSLELFPIELQEDETYKLRNRDEDRIYRYCSNYQYGVCNWLVPATSSSRFCKACQLNRTIPNLEKPEYLKRWKVLEVAKHRLVYSLIRMRLPLFSKARDQDTGLIFDFLADEKKEGQAKVLTGHDAGLITINIAEADTIEREMAKRAMDEVYRTVLGHFRHEIGHYYWDRLIFDTPHLDTFREMFGDERESYADALKKHYKDGPPQGWQQDFISAYATTHPWEDWAESWAHYLHIIDTLETAYAFGLTVQPVPDDLSSLIYVEMKTDPYEVPDFDAILSLWLPLTFTMNNLNRSMGLSDPYPFVISPKITEKLDYIHQVCYEARSL